jgi:hypothetical protein
MLGDGFADVRRGADPRSERTIEKKHTAFDQKFQHVVALEEDPLMARYEIRLRYQIAGSNGPGAETQMRNRPYCHPEPRFLRRRIYAGPDNSIDPSRQELTLRMTSLGSCTASIMHGRSLAALEKARGMGMAHLSKARRDEAVV